MNKRVSIAEVYPDMKNRTTEEILHDLLLTKVDNLKGTNAITALKVIHSHSNSMKMTELQSVMGLTQYKFYEELARLEGAGLIEKKRNPSDNRFMIVELTNEGLYVMQYTKG